MKRNKKKQKKKIRKQKKRNKQKCNIIVTKRKEKKATSGFTFWVDPVFAYEPNKKHDVCFLTSVFDEDFKHLFCLLTKLCIPLIIQISPTFFRERGEYLSLGGGSM